MGAHLVVDISGHGYGHVAQTAPVVNALRARLPALKLTIRGNFPDGVLESRFRPGFDVVRRHNDVGMCMASAVEVLTDQSAAEYRTFHADWDRRIDAECEALQRLRPSVLLANIPYASLAAAARAGIPALAMCSLNWAAIYQHYCGQREEAPTIHAQILHAYRSASAFLRLAPGLPMTDLPNLHPIDFVATRGKDCRQALAARLNLSDSARLALVAFGGVATDFPIEQWPALPSLRWLVPGKAATRRADVVQFDPHEFPFLDVLASSDVVLTKPGYGTFAEAACNGVAVLTVRRADWPEDPYLRQWLAAHTNSAEIEQSRLWSGSFAPELEQLLAAGRGAPVHAAGVEQAAEVFTRLLQSPR
jgi:hypothetical protein